MQRVARLARPMARLVKGTQVSKFSMTTRPVASTIGRNFRFAGLQNVKRNFAVEVEPLDSLGDSITTAVLLSWNKQPGDPVFEDDVIAVVETDKVTMDIRAKKTGTFVKGLAAEQGEISVGNPLYEIDTAAVPAAGAKNAAAAPAAIDAAVPAPAVVPAPAAAAASGPPKEAIVINVPIMGESITTGVLAQWTVAAGDFVNADQVVAILETDKVNVEVQCPESGTIESMLFNDGDEVNVGEPLYKLIPGQGTPKTTAAAAPQVTAAAPTAPKAVATASPAAPKAAAAAAPAATATPAAAAAGDRTETRVKLTRMRARISQRLKESQNTAAALTTFQEVDMTNLMAMRNKHKEQFEKVHGVKLGFMSAFVKASSEALLEIPAINAVIDDNTGEIVYRNYVDISVAVASPNGLVVPVLRNTDKMSFSDVEKTIGHFGAKAKANNLALEDMTGGTFTISNGGTFGSLFGTPIINQPQSAILGMHATKMRAVVVDGKVEARPMMYLALTYDHRLIDGREAVTFLKAIQNKIEDPQRLLLSI